MVPLSLAQLAEQGGSCGDCALLYTPQYGCSGGQCECVPQREGKVCGADGCGGSCGACTHNGTCSAGSCSCLLQCDGDMLVDEACVQWFCPFFGFTTCMSTPPDVVPHCE